MYWTAYIILFCHLFSSIGITWNKHICGEHVSFNIYGFHLGETCYCEHNEANHEDACCKDKKVEAKFIKKETIQKTSSFSFQLCPFVLAFLLPKYGIGKCLDLVIESPFKHCLVYINGPPLFIKHGIFRI